MKIIWTDFATNNLKDIFDYYSNKTKKKLSIKFAKKL